MTNHCSHDTTEKRGDPPPGSSDVLHDAHDQIVLRSVPKGLYHTAIAQLDFPMTEERLRGGGSG
jgi:hypothetical protein